MTTIYSYELPPLDYGWFSMITVQDYYKSLFDEFQDSEIALAEINKTKKFIDSALKRARQKGWEGDFRNGPHVFLLPGDGSMIPAIIWKQDNNGTTFVASPIKLLWLDE